MGVEKPLCQYFGTDSSPLGGGAMNAVEVFAYAKDFSTMLLPARGEGVGYASREMTERSSV
jgi:hypothetical protein